MLGGGDDVTALDSFDQADSHPRRKKWILAKIFEVASAHRCAIDVHGGSKNEVNAARSGIVAHHCAHSLGEIGVPCCRKRYAGRIRCGGTVVVNAHWAIGHFQFGDADSGHRANEEIVDATDVRDLLFEGHPAEDGLHPLIKVGLRLREGCRGCNPNHTDEYNRASNPGNACELHTL